MKINKKIYTLALGLTLLLPMSCTKDFLEQQNTRDATEGSLFKTPDDALKLVAGIYDTFHNNDFLIKALWYQANFLTQDYQNWGSDAFFTTYEIPTDFGALEVFWNRSYQGIARANSALQILETMKTNGYIDEALANRLKGEAYFLRGIFHYYLATEFGAVPLVLELATDDGRHPRNSQDEVFTAVAADMKAAAELLPWPEDQAASDVGRATKGAAYAYLGDAQMWLKQYDDAVISFNQLEGHYSLEEDFIDIHDYENQNGKETIFSVQYIAASNMDWGTRNDTQWLSAFCMPEEITTMGYSYVTKNYSDSFEPGDVRKRASVIGPGEEHPDPKIKISEYPNVIAKFGSINTAGTVANPWKGGDGQRSGYFAVKTWRDPRVNGGAGGSETPYRFSAFNQILMRYGGVLLSKAEALYKSGNTGEAWNILNNVIRDRANLGAAAGDFDAAISNEYRHELGGEYSTFFYLRRMGEGAASKFVKDKYGITIPQGHELMPIPSAAIASNSALLPQNTGY